MKKLSELLNNEEQAGKMERFFVELLSANEKMNLTAITGREEAEQKHFIDSLSARALIYGDVLDIGTGAGFPGIPLAIARPDIQFTLNDSTGKKIDFLNSVIQLLELKNTVTLKARAEELPKQKKYDCVLTRGVGALNTVCEYGLPYVKTGGICIAYKGPKYAEEIKEAQNALKILGGTVEKIQTYQLETGGEIQERALVVIRKIKDCDMKYPRGNNKPRLKPL